VERIEDSKPGSSYRILADEKTVYKAPKGSGIHPREASRHHIANCSSVLEKALEVARVGIDDVDFIAYSAGPGLGPCLRVGAVVARSLASYHEKPIVPTNHAIGHIELGKFLCGLEDPLVILVSGGHTALAAQIGAHWKVFGETLDLTLGQLIDQLGRFLGLSSPAGPEIEKLANQVKDHQESTKTILALPYIIKGNDVSYSGLLSAAKGIISEGNIKSEVVAYAVQEVAFSILAEATERALAFTDKSELLVTGGVAANQRLASILGTMCSERKVKSGIIPKGFSGDCGAQIALAGFRFYDSANSKKTTTEHAFVRQSWRIDQVILQRAGS
jgi:N6-L-threonylcarbamoyladenine synthase